MSSSSHTLPIYDVAESLRTGLAAAGRVVLSAPTGSGKSTQVPQMLLDDVGIAGEVVVLQPRRLATRLLAQRVAAERGVRLGSEVGYQIRFENVVSRHTRIRFVTEAILLRQILADPALKGVGAIIFDEFHERHLTSDLSLACALQTVSTIRPDLKLLVMSATLDVDSLVSFLDPCVRVEAAGRMYPVEVNYMGAALGRQAAPVWERATRSFKKFVARQIAGDVLIFMPGAFEIRKTIAALQALPAAADYEILPLHGALSPQAQDRAVASGTRPKVIVATNVAETSITIAGVRTVIDGGLARVARYDARRGINAVLVEPISRASAEQRAGRAGRTGPGICLRLWSEAEHAARAERDEAEVKRVDLSETVLMLAVAGINAFAAETSVPSTEATEGDFVWYEAPEAEALERAYVLLRDLGALESTLADGHAEEGGVLACRAQMHRTSRSVAAGSDVGCPANGHATTTELGQQMSNFPLHPRYARLLIEADSLGVLSDAALIAALSQGRPIYRVAREERVRCEQVRQIEDSVDARSDFFVQLKAWEWAQVAKFKPQACEALGIHAGAARQAGAVAEQILKQAKAAGLGQNNPVSSSPVAGGISAAADGSASAVERICKCLLVAFSDQLAQRNDAGTRRCRMVHGRSGELRRESVVEGELFVAAEIEERELRGEVSVLLGLATAVETQCLEDCFPEEFSEGVTTSYDASSRRVVCRSERRFRDLVLASKERDEANYEQAASLLATEVFAGRLHLKKWNAVVENWIQRVNFVAKHCPETELAPIDDAARLLLLEQICHGASSYKEIKDRPVLSTVKDWIRPEQVYYIETYAPAEMHLPRKKRPARIRYEADGRAILSSKLQDFYDVPGKDLRVANGQVPLLVELLAPNQRPAHLTDDLDGFWQGAYQHVRKELAGRYPKHEWR